MIKWILTKIVGTKNQREVRRLRPIVEQIVSIEESWNGKGTSIASSPWICPPCALWKPRPGKSWRK